MTFTHTTSSEQRIRLQFPSHTEPSMSSESVQTAYWIPSNTGFSMPERKPESLLLFASTSREPQTKRTLPLPPTTPAFISRSTHSLVNASQHSLILESTWQTPSSSTEPITTNGKPADFK